MRPAIPLLWLLVLLGMSLACPDGDENFDFDGDGFDDAVDCEPEDPKSYPNAEEQCHDGVDNDCDGQVDGDDVDCAGDDDTGTDDDDDDDDDVTDDDDTTSGWDDDGDGYTVAEGDCDDTNPLVHPGVIHDGCDAYDSDCDGCWNEDDVPSEAGGYETCSDTVPYEYGLLGAGAYAAFGYIAGPGDVDGFRFDLVEGPDTGSETFRIEADVDNVTAGLDVRVRIVLVSGVLGTDVVLVDADHLGPGSPEVAQYSGVWGMDNTGTYLVEVSGVDSTYDCGMQYGLTLTLTD